MVRSSKVTVKFVEKIERHSRNGHIGPIMFVVIVVCACIQHAIVFKKLLLFHKSARGKLEKLHLLFEKQI